MPLITIILLTNHAQAKVVASGRKSKSSANQTTDHKRQEFDFRRIDALDTIAIVTPVRSKSESRKGQDESEFKVQPFCSFQFKSFVIQHKMCLSVAKYGAQEREIKR